MNVPLVLLSRFLLMILILGFACQSAAAQPSEPRREIGVFVGAINFNGVLGEKPFATGLRFGYRLTDRLAVETEVNSCPQDPSHNFGQLLLLAGPRLGVRIGPLSVGGKLRAGVIHFGGRAFARSIPTWWRSLCST
jgi:hypothetical protein